MSGSLHPNVSVWQRDVLQVRGRLQEVRKPVEPRRPDRSLQSSLQGPVYWKAGRIFHCFERLIDRVCLLC